MDQDKLIAKVRKCFNLCQAIYSEVCPPDQDAYNIDIDSVETGLHKLSRELLSLRNRLVREKKGGK